MAKATFFFQRILWGSRLMVYLPVIAGIISAFFMVIMGSVEIFHAFSHLIGIVTTDKSISDASNAVVTSVVGAVDSYLIATVMLIFSTGLYELFINKIEVGDGGTDVTSTLIVHNLDQLKEKLANVVIMVLIVTYFKYAISVKYTSLLDLLYLSVGILLIALAMYLGHKRIQQGQDPIGI